MRVSPMMLTPQCGDWGETEGSQGSSTDAWNRSSILPEATSCLSSNLSIFSLAVALVITLTNSSYTGLREEVASLETSASTPIISSFSEIDP